MPEPAEAASTEQAPSRAPAATPTQPWTVALRRFALQNLRVLIAFAMLIAGVVFIVLGWYGAANTSEIYAQIPYLISGGLLGLGLIIVSGILAAGALQERSIDALRSEVARAVGEAVANSAPYTPERPTTAAATNGRHVYVLNGGRSFHEAGCPMLEGKDAKELVPARAAVEGFAPCKLCGPD